MLQTLLILIFSVGNEFGATATLSDFLREKRVSMGTKIMCKQGGCGICIVEAKMQLSPSHPKVSANLNSVRTKQKSEKTYLLTCVIHYENTPIQIYRQFHLQKLKIFR